MCSIADARLAQIGEAIEEVARAALAGTAEPAGLGELTSRLAGIWAMVAELDPALAASVPGYIRESEPADGAVQPGADPAGSAARPWAGG